uniref:Polyprotein n=1 Tax=Picornavirales sp. TaxID=1955153 RepID=A0A6M3YNU5_9VIRU|nr:MAG: hypothetical protein 1 [Picornavirales sp.]
MVVATYQILRTSIHTGAAVAQAAIHACSDKTGFHGDHTGFEIYEEPIKQVMGHCLAMPHGWGDLPTHYDPVEIAEYWRTNPPVKNIGLEYLTLGEFVTLRLLDTSTILPVSTEQLLVYLSYTYNANHAFVKMPHISMRLSWRHMFLAFTAISHSFADCTVSGIEQYNKLISLLAPLGGNERRYSTHCCSIYFDGDIEHLATRTDAANIRYVLRKLKPANTIPLLFELFDSPTWKGKFSSIMRLIELFEIDASNVSTEALHSIAEFVLRIAQWIMEKTQIGVEFMKNKCGWRKIEESSVDLREMQCKPPPSIKCACGKESTHGCSLCVHHHCDECKGCDCPNEYKHIMAACKCDNNQDCLYRALHQATKIDVKIMKQRLWQQLQLPIYPAMYERMLDTYDIRDWMLSYGEFVDAVRREINVNEMCGIDTLMAFSMVFNYNIEVRENDQIHHFQIAEIRPWINLHLATAHYTYIEETTPLVPTHFLWGSPFTQFSHLPGFLSQLEKRACMKEANSSSTTPTATPPSTTPSTPGIETPVIAPTPTTMPINPNTLSIVLNGLEPTYSSDSDSESEYFTQMIKELDDSGPHEQDAVESEKKVEEEVQVEKGPSFIEALKAGEFGSCCKMFGGWLKDSSREVVQFFEDSPFVSGLFAIVAGIANFLGLYCVMPTTRRGIAGLMDRFQNVTKTMHYARQGFKGVLDSVKDVFSCFKDFLGIEDNSDLSIFKRELGDALVKCKNMLVTAQSKPGVFINDSKAYLDFRKDYHALLNLYSKLVKFSNTRELAILNPIWFALSKTYESLTHIYTKFVNGMNSRIVPVCIYLWGGSNLGKSAVLSHLSNLLNTKLERSMSSYTISKGNTHWNNFGGHEIIRLDDVNAFISPAEGDVDSLHLFNLVTDAPFIPMQAAIPDKGVMAAPHFVIAASNLPSLPSNTCISDVQAWERRRHLCINVSWPEHEKKCGIRTDCEHFKDLKLDNFDHLTFTIVDPVMSSMRDSKNLLRSVKTGCEYAAKVIETKPRDKVIQAGQKVSLDKIVDMASKLHIVHKNNFAIAYEAAVKAGTMKQETSAWSKKPVVMLDGQPGTGKSHIFQRFMELAKEDALHLTTNKDFEQFAKSGYVANGKKFVVIDDTTPLSANPELWNQFVQLINQLYNSVQPPPYTVICGVNSTVLKSKFSEDTINQITRRAAVIKSHFNPRPRLEMFLNVFKDESISKFYTCKDIEENFAQEDKSKIRLMSDFVSYRVGKENLTQDGVAKRLLAHVPAIVPIISQNTLTLRREVAATCLCKLDITANKLLKTVVDSNITNIISLIGSSRLNTLQGSKLDQAGLAKALKSIADRTASLKDVTFESFDDLLLQARNQNLLEAFKGEVALLLLKDKAYFIDYTKTMCDAGIFDLGMKEIVEAVRDLKVVTSFSTVEKVKSVITSVFPPWFVLAMDIFGTIMSVITPILSSVFSIQNSVDLHDSYRIVQPIQDIISKGADAIMERSTVTLANKLGVKELARDVYNVNQLVPGANHINKPQYAYADTLPAEAFTSEVDDPTRFDLETFPDKPKQQKVTWNGETFPDKIKQQKVTWNGETFPDKHKQKPVQWNESTRNSKHAVPEYAPRPFVSSALTAPVPEATATARVFHAASPDAPKIVQQVSTDPALYPIVNHLIKNVGEVLSNTGERLCSGIFVRGRTFRTVLHLENYSDINTLRIKTLDGRIWSTKVVHTEPVYDRLDLAVTDHDFPAKPDISKHLPQKTNLIPEGTYAVLVTPNTTILNSPSFSIRSYQIKDVLYKYFSEEKIGQYVVDYRGHKGGFMLQGPVQTTYGDCGSLLILADPNLNHGKLLGIHTSASTFAAYASPMYCDQYEDRKFQCIENSSKFNSSIFSLPPNDSKGIARSHVPIYVPSKTKLFENWFPLGEKMYEPSVLDGNDTRSQVSSVLYDEAIKWCKPRVVIPEEDKVDLKECMKDVAMHFVDVLKASGTKLKTLTSMEAMNKYQGSSHSEPINLHTSAGFPWNLNTRRAGKQDYIVSDAHGIRRWNNENKVKVNQLQSSINQYLSPALHSKQNSAVFQVFLKDEPVKLKKIYETTRTRTIAAAPIDYQIAYRRYIHTAHCAIMDNWHELPVKVGINPLSLDWHTLFTSLSKTNMRAVDLDYKEWDFSADPFMIDLLADFYDILFKNLDPNYAPIDKEIRDNLYAHIKNFNLLIGRTLYRATGGIPSGYPGTSFDNSIINYLITYWAFRQIARRRNTKLLNFYSFNQLVTCAIYGDDIVMTVNSQVLKDFNGLSIPSVVARLGYVAQPADKGSTFVSSRPLKDCIFLSRHFKFTSGIWIGPLQLDHLFKPSWYVSDRRSHKFWETPHEKCQSPDIVASSYESMLYEAALHPDEVFDMVRDAAIKVYGITKLRLPLQKKEAISRIFGSSLRVTTVEGLTFHQIHDIIQNYNPPSRPPHISRFHNRVSYSYGPKYEYTGSNQPSNPLPKVVKKLLIEINQAFGKEWNSVLVNEYPVGGEIPYHKDDEPGLDLDHGILGVTIFGDGQIEFKNHNVQCAYFLSPGSAYLMEKRCLTDYHHRRTNHQRASMSLTFRKID